MCWGDFSPALQSEMRSAAGPGQPACLLCKEMLCWCKAAVVSISFWWTYAIFHRLQFLKWRASLPFLQFWPQTPTESSGPLWSPCRSQVPPIVPEAVPVAPEGAWSSYCAWCWLASALSSHCLCCASLTNEPWITFLLLSFCCIINKLCTWSEFPFWVETLGVARDARGRNVKMAITLYFEQVSLSILGKPN